MSFKDFVTKTFQLNDSKPQIWMQINFYFIAPFFNLTTVNITSTAVTEKFFLSKKTTLQNDEVVYEKICITKIVPCEGKLLCQEVDKRQGNSTFSNLKPYCTYTFVGHFTTKMDSKCIPLMTPAVEVKTLASSILFLSLIIIDYRHRSEKSQDFLIRNTKKSVITC